MNSTTPPPTESTSHEIFFRGKAADISIFDESSHLLCSLDPRMDLDCACAECGIDLDLPRSEKIEKVNAADPVVQFMDGHKGERFYTPGLVCATRDRYQAMAWAQHNARHGKPAVVCEFYGEWVSDLLDGVLVKPIEIIAETVIE